MSKKIKNWENGVVSIPPEQVEIFIKQFRYKVFQKLKQKGFGTFNSTQEVIGKLTEEKMEMELESHGRDLSKFCDEALDCAVVGFWGYCSGKSWKKKAAKKDSKKK